MKHFLIFISLLLFSLNSRAQILSYTIKGDMFYNSKTISPVKFQTEEFDRTYNEYFQLNYTHYLKKHPITLQFEAKSFLGFSDFTYVVPTIANSYKGYGGSNIKIYRGSAGVGYRFFRRSTRFDVEPYFLFSFEKSVFTWEEGKQLSAVLAIPQFLPYQGRVYIEPIERFQILPQVGINANIRLLWRFFLTANLSYSYGFRPYQKQTFEYSFDGVPQPNASYYSDGTGFFYSLGVGFELYGNNMYQKKKGRFTLRNIL